MPKPPLFPTIDWRQRFSEGMDWSTWLSHSEHPDYHAEILDRVERPLLTDADRRRLDDLGQTVHVFVIAEDWCPDVVRHLPLLECMARHSDRVQVRYFLRTQAPLELERHLFNGSESVPCLIFLSQAFSECASWGPMGETCREFLSRGRGCGDMKAARELVFAYYADHPACRAEIDELLYCLEVSATSASALRTLG